MLFVDGENFTIRAQAVAKANQVELNNGPFFLNDVFLWFPNFPATRAMTNSDGTPTQVQHHAIRAHYYTSVVGDEVKLQETRASLHALGFQPSVFKKDKKSQRTKGVDISLATDVLSNTFQDNFDVAVLVAGDADYIPLIAEVKRKGKLVYLVFFGGPSAGLNRELELASDRFFDCTNSLIESWRTPSTSVT